MSVQSTAGPVAEPLPTMVGTSRLVTVLYPVGSFVALLLIWEIMVRVFQVPEFFIPPPTSIAQAFSGSFDLYILHLSTTVYTTLIAFSIAFCLAVFTGTLISEIRFMQLAIFPILVALQSMPKIALAPIIIVWFGFGVASKIVLGTLSAFFPILHNTVHGLRVIDSDQIALMRTFKATRLQIFLKVKLPNALPFLFAGVNVAVILAMLSVIVGEFLGASRGMGFLIMTQSTQFNTAGVLAGVALLSLVGVTFHYVLQFLRRKLLFWSAGTEAAGMRPD